MLIPTDNYNAVSYLKNYGSDVFDPIDYYNINKSLYDKTFLELLKHILCLTGEKCNQIYKKRDIIIDPEVVIETDDFIINTEEFKNLIRYLLILLNDLMKFFVSLYNILMGFSTIIKNGDINIIEQNKQSIKDLFIKVNLKQEDFDDFIKLLPISISFTPMLYTPYKIEIIYEFTIEQLIGLSDYLIDRVIEIEKGIMELLQLSEKTKFILDIETISKEIVDQIVPITDHKPSTEYQLGGTTGKVILAYNELLRLKNSLENITSLSLEKEIPTGIGLEIDKAKNLIKDISYKITNFAAHADDTVSEQEKSKKEYGFNLFESIPSSYGVSGVKINTNIQAELPEDNLELIGILEIENTITTKMNYFNDRIKGIRDLANNLNNFKSKINDYKNTELQGINSLNFKFSNKLSKAEIELEISRIKGIVEPKQEEINKLNEDKPKYEDSNFKTYINEKATFLKYQSSIVSVDTVARDQLIKDLNKIFSDYLVYNDNLANDGKPGIDSSGVIIDTALDNLKTVFNLYKVNKFNNGVVKNTSGKIFDDTMFDRANFLKNSVNCENIVDFIKLTESNKFNSTTMDDAADFLGSKNVFKSTNIKRKDITKNILDKFQDNIQPKPNNSQTSQMKQITTKLNALKLLLPANILSTPPTDPSSNDNNPMVMSTIPARTYIDVYNDLGIDIRQDITVTPNKPDDKLQERIDLITRKISDLTTQINTENPIDGTTGKKKLEKLQEESALSSDSLTYNFKNKIVVDARFLKQKILLLHNKIRNINNKLIELFKLKDGDSAVNYNLMETSINKENIDEIIQGWYNKTFLIQTGGGGKDIYKKNVDELNKLSSLNNKMLELIVLVETYKSTSTNLFQKYIDVVNSLQEVMIYVYYKITVYDTTSKGTITISKRFNKLELDALKNTIQSITRRNFSLIKEYYKKVIDKIRDQQDIDPVNNIYVEYDLTKTKELLSLFVLYHLETNSRVL